MRYVLLFIFFRENLILADSLDTPLKIVFLTPDVAEGYDLRGCTPDIAQQLIYYLKTQYPKEYVFYDVKKLIKQNENHTIYLFQNIIKRSAISLMQILFLMFRLVKKDHDDKGECIGYLYEIKIKAYSYISKKEIFVFAAQNVPAYKFADHFKGKEEDIFAKIKTISKK